jgi:DNA-binding CsgD family transcriptional regulator
VSHRNDIICSYDGFAVFPAASDKGEVMPIVSEVDRLIGRAYDCLVEQDSWDSLLASCTELVGGDSAAIYVKPRDGTAGALLASHGLEPSYKLTKYLSYYESRSPLIAHYRHKPEGHLSALGDYAFSSPYRETEYFQDWIRPQGFADMLGGHLVRTPQLYAWLGFRRTEKLGTYSHSQICVANRVAWHLSRVIKLGSKLGFDRDVANGIRESLEVVTFGVLIVDASGKVLTGNRAADTILKAGDGLKSRHGRLVCERLREGTALHDAIRAVAQPQSTRHQAVTDFRISRSVARVPLTIHVVPIPSISTWKGLAPPSSVAGLFLVDPLRGAADVDGFASAHGLTAAERRVLREVVQCGGLVDAAAKLRVTVPTARTQLQHIFRKTNAKSQAELVRLVMMSPLQSRSKI